MAMITLLTDWGYADPYVPALKGAILSQFPEVTVVDISHSIQRDNILHGSFTLKNSWKTFPEGTVHLCGMNALTRPPVLMAVRHEKHFFVGADDGFFPLVFKGQPEEWYYVLSSKKEKVMSGTRTLATTAIFLAKTGKIEEVGVPVDSNYHRIMLAEASQEGNVIRGMIVHVDVFGNLITNIGREFYKSVSGGRRCTIHAKNSKYRMDSIMKSPYEVDHGEVSAYFNDYGLLEIAINKGSAYQLLGMKYGEPVIMEFT